MLVQKGLHIEVDGKVYNVIARQSGFQIMFVVELGKDDTLYSYDLKTLAGQISRRNKKKKIKFDVPFVMVERGKLIRATATGLHATSEELLYRVDGEARRGREYGLTPLKCMSDEEMAEGQRIHDEMVRTSTAWYKWRTENKFELEKQLRLRVKAALEEMESGTKKANSSDAAPAVEVGSSTSVT